MIALDQGPRMRFLVSLDCFIFTYPSRTELDSSLFSSSESESSSIWSIKLKAYAKAPGISPTSLSLNEGLALGPVAWLSSEGEEAREPPLNSAWLMSFTFLLLRANSASPSLESVRGCMMLRVKYLITCNFISVNQ